MGIFDATSLRVVGWEQGNQIIVRLYFFYLSCRIVYLFFQVLNKLWLFYLWCQSKPDLEYFKSEWNLSIELLFNRFCVCVCVWSTIRKKVTNKS